MASEPIELHETTVTEVNGVSVGCGNLWERDFEAPDGTTYEAMSARLSFGDVALDVHVGSRFRLVHETYRVSAIDKPDGARGHVVVEQD